MCKITVLIFSFLFLLSGFVFAQPDISVVADNIVSNDPLYYDHTPNIARSSDGDLVVVWNSAEGQVVFSKYDPSFQTWSPAVALSNAGDEANKAGIVADDSGNLYCVWQQRETSGEDYAIFFSKYDGVSWSTPVNLTGNDVENEECAIAVSSLDHVFVAWNTDTEDDGLEFVLCIKSEDGGENWSTPDTLSSRDGIIGGTSGTSGRPVLATATGGKMLCVWHEEPDGHPDRESFLSQYDGSSWSDELVYIDVPDSANSMYPAVAADSEDNIYMMYVSFVSREELKMLKKSWEDVTWPNPPETLFNDTQLTKPNLVFDANDNMYVCFRRDNAADTTYGLEEAAYMTSEDKGVTWSEQVRLSRENYDAGYDAMALKVTDAGIDFLWRESYVPFLDDADTTAILHGRVDLLPSSIQDNNLALVRGYRLNQNFPNPFNPTTEITFTIGKSGEYEIAVFNTLGQKIRVLESGKYVSGEYKVIWDGKSQNHNNVASGLYYYQLKGENVVLTKKMVLIR